MFDRIRAKYVRLTPEEYVRQHLIHYLEELGYPRSLMSVERSLPGSVRRYDLLMLDRDGRAFLLAECKSPQVGVGSAALDQLNGYILSQRVPYAILTDGLEHHFLAIDKDQVRNYQQIPPYVTLSH